MYRNLEVELKRRNMTHADLGQSIGMDDAALSMRFNGKREWRLSEMRKVQTALGNQHTLEYLFAVQDEADGGAA